MAAIAHGWKPDRMKHAPSRAVAREYHQADKRAGIVNGRRRRHGGHGIVNGRRSHG